MFSFFTIFVAIALSIYIWGIVRTALWLLPSILINLGVLLGSGIVLSFFCSCGLVIPHIQGAYDARNLTREKKTLLFFFSGLLSGTLFYAIFASVVFFVAGAFVPYLLLKIFMIFKHPVSEVLFLSPKLKWIVAASWILALILCNLEAFLAKTAG